jgi:hypothetical protein
VAGGEVPLATFAAASPALAFFEAVRTAGTEADAQPPRTGPRAGRAM